ncbi:hypothetical protein vB_RpoS-V16_73 [Ruegeria phage vB_RpoS-V16]|nr:hypothetical protein JT311_gp73 [Ruegeria phage vB_RpoS-V16]AWY09509.1 hypothetical protein vB_RpoS-V16_73 [Ruegeria phage vB_RpoS-V16]
MDLPEFRRLRDAVMGMNK